MENRTETYYSGPLSEASFTVPEGITRVLFQFRGPEGTQIRSLSLSDGTKIPTSYTLLPENLVSRFQKNLFQDRSFLLRVQYLKDGWTLFTVDGARPGRYGGSADLGAALLLPVPLSA